MDEIQEDIRRVAYAIAPGDYETLVKIALALFAERERCARIAEAEIVQGSTAYSEGYDDACRDIATAIRTPPTGEEQ